MVPKLILDIEKNKKNYWPRNMETVELSMLYSFLTDFYYVFEKDTIQWLSNPDPDFTSSNAVSVSYWPDQKTFEIEDIIFGEEGNLLIIKQNELIKIVSEWEKLLQHKPDQIIITQNENGTFTLIGKFIDHREI